MELANHERYYGEFAKGNKHGFGIWHFFVNDRVFEYKGDFQDDKRHGKGMLTAQASRVKYDGEWQDDYMHGTGVYIWPYQFPLSVYRVYVGEYAKDKRNGKGFAIFQNNDHFLGQWENDLKVGPGLFKHAGNNEVYEVEYVEDSKQGDGELVQSVLLDDEHLVIPTCSHDAQRNIGKEVSVVITKGNHAVGISTATFVYMDPITNKLTT